MKLLNSTVLIAVLSLVICLGSCENRINNELTEQEKQHIIQEIETLMNDVYNPENAGFEKLISIKANKEGYLFASTGKIRDTEFSSYEARLKENLKALQSVIDLKTTKMFVYPLSSNSASCTFEAEAKFINPEGDTITTSGCWTYVFKKFDDGWKVIHENGAHSN
jgi:hypothetical protein